MADFVRVPEADWQDICDSVREKTGGTDGLLSGEVAPAVRGIQSGEEVFYASDGRIYIKDVIVPDSVTLLAVGAYNVNGFISVYAPEVTDLGGHYCFGQAWNSMQRIICPKLTSWGGAYWCNGGDLKEVQAGSVGYPVTSMPNNRGFANNTNADLVITIYVDATELAGVPTDISDYAPFGATNATIIYRNSTTGEVITE